MVGVHFGCTNNLAASLSTCSNIGQKSLTIRIQNVRQMSPLCTDIYALLKSAKPHFADERLEHFDRSKFNGCRYTTTPADQGSVDLSKVKGTDHPDYCGNTWIELLPTNPDDFMQLDYWERFKHEGMMKRGWNCVRDMRENPAYYTDAGEKEHWSFCKVGDSYYISQGNHRTVMARFLLSLNGLPEVIRGVSVTEYHVPQAAPRQQPKWSLWRAIKW